MFGLENWPLKLKNGLTFYANSKVPKRTATLLNKWFFPHNLLFGKLYNIHVCVDKRCFQWYTALNSLSTGLSSCS